MVSHTTAQPQALQGAWGNTRWLSRQTWVLKIKQERSCAIGPIPIATSFCLQVLPLRCSSKVTGPELQLARNDLRLQVDNPDARLHAKKSSTPAANHFAQNHQHRFSTLSPAPTTSSLTKGLQLPIRLSSISNSALRKTVSPECRVALLSDNRSLPRQ